MLVNPIRNISFNGKVQVGKRVIDTNDLPKAKYTECKLDSHYIKQFGKFVKIGTRAFPVYVMSEPCLRDKNVSSDYTDLVMTLPDGEEVTLGDYSSEAHNKAQEVLQRARAGETGPGGKPLNLKV